MLVSAAFYLFSAIVLISAFQVITAKNPVHSVLFLILAFFNAAGLFVLLGAEFIAMILLKAAVGIFATMFGLAHAVEILRVATSVSTPEGSTQAKMFWYLGHSSCVCLGIVISMIMFRATQDGLRKMAAEEGDSAAE